MQRCVGHVRAETECLLACQEGGPLGLVEHLALDQAASLLASLEADDGRQTAQVPLDALGTVGLLPLVTLDPDDRALWVSACQTRADSLGLSSPSNASSTMPSTARQSCRQLRHASRSTYGTPHLPVHDGRVEEEKGAAGGGAAQAVDFVRVSDG
jgi:hypothetical protein